LAFMGRQRLAVACLALVSAVSHAGKVYRCGNYFGDERAGPDADCQVIEITGDDRQDAPASGIVRRQQGDVVEITNLSPSPAPGKAKAPPQARSPVETTAPPPFVNTANNVFDAAAGSDFSSFASRWRSHDQPIKILHIGDSHVRNGIAAEVTRRLLQNVRGDGGRGLIFPYAVAGSYSLSDYQSSREGSWQGGSTMRPLSDLSLGILGFAARPTGSRAAFSLRFAQPISAGRKSVKILLNGVSPGLRITASTSKENASWLSPGVINGLSTAEFKFSDAIDRLRIDIEGSTQRLVLHGVDVEKEAPGLVYHSMGVDGATLRSLDKARHMESELAILQPDLVILDFGSNELHSDSLSLPPQLESAMLNTIRRIRSVRPQAAIVFSSPQDMRTHRRPNAVTSEAFVKNMRKFALDNNCLFWDWHRIAGGVGAMQAWRASGLANRDQVHLAPKGYRLKGELLARAVLNTINSHGAPQLAAHEQARITPGGLGPTSLK
jgi:lysophospholipase L1-like esterase